MSVDLHTHTTHSDGTLRPTELIKLASEKGLEAISITDHDITSGIDEALISAKEYDIKFIPGIELSVDYDLPGKGHLHVLGYFIDSTHPLITQILQNLREERMNRNRKILDRLEILHMPITPEELAMESRSGSVGRPHIAAAMVKKGYVKNMQEAFQRFLKKGAPAYIDRIRLDVNQAIDLIHIAGGIAIMAHPETLGLSSQKALESHIIRLKTLGLDGIEVYCSGLCETTRQQLLQFARTKNLVVSGGSDFHGTVKPEIQLGSGEGDLNIPNQIYHDLVKYWKEKN